jgi:putative ABC transport system substrate-binding protein
VRRREFITLVGGAAVGWPLAARAQQTDPIRRVGVLMGYGETDPEAKALRPAIQPDSESPCVNSASNVRMDVRWALGSTDAIHTFAKELVELQSDVILANTTPVTAALQRETHSIPIVFTIVGDPIGSGFVASLPRPGGNITGLGVFEASITSKWLDLLRKIAPDFRRAAFMFNPDTAPYINSFLMPSFEAAVEAFKVAPIIAPVHSSAEIEAIITSLGREPGGALLVGPDNFMDTRHTSIIALAARNKVPAVYHSPVSARDGGLLSYGADFQDIFHRASHYVDRILRGAKPSELPVQLPTKYLMVINLKTAMALGLTVPPSILVSADEVIE